MKAKDVEITRDWLRERCLVERDEDGREHWIWRLAAPNGNPRGHMRDGSFHGAQFNVRPAVYVLTHPGKRVGTAWVAVAACEVDGCVHPDCIKLQRRNADRKGVKRPASVRAKISATKRAKFGSPSPEVVRAVRAMPGTARATSQALGIKLNAVQHIRQGKGLRDFSDPIDAMVAQLR